VISNLCQRGMVILPAIFVRTRRHRDSLDAPAAIVPDSGGGQRSTATKKMPVRRMRRRITRFP
jgi:hypothetical protein